METKYFGEFRDVYSKASDDVYSKALTDMYSKAVSEMYSQFKQKEAHPMDMYIGRHADYSGEPREVVGYAEGPGGSRCLIIDGSEVGGWRGLGLYDVVFKKCERYCYVSMSDVID